MTQTVIHRLARSTTRAACRAQRRLRTGRGIAVGLGAVPDENRGDQAMNTVLADLFCGYDGRDLLAFQTSARVPQSLLGRQAMGIENGCSTFFSSGKSVGQEIRFMRRVADRRELLILGADVVDAAYGLGRTRGMLYPAEVANRVGVPARILGFSVSQTPDADVTQLFEKLIPGTRLLVRDPVSFRRMQEAGLHGVELVADTAFLLHPAEADELDERFQPFLQANVGRILGVNVTEVAAGAEDDQREPRLDWLAQTFADLARTTDHRLMLIAHTEGGVAFTRALHERIAAIDPELALLIDPLPHARHLKRLAGCCRMVFSCRMHLAIATLGMGVPVTCFPYLGKFAGLFEHFGLDESGLIHASELPTGSAELLQRLTDRVQQIDPLTQQVESRLPQVRQMSWANFQGLVDPADTNQTADPARFGAAQGGGA